MRAATGFKRRSNRLVTLSISRIRFELSQTTARILPNSSRRRTTQVGRVQIFVSHGGSPLGVLRADFFRVRSCRAKPVFVSGGHVEPVRARRMRRGGRDEVSRPPATRTQQIAAGDSTCTSDFVVARTRSQRIDFAKIARCTLEERQFSGLLHGDGLRDGLKLFRADRDLRLAARQPRAEDGEDKAALRVLRGHVRRKELVRVVVAVVAAEEFRRARARNRTRTGEDVWRCLSWTRRSAKTTAGGEKRGKPHPAIRKICYRA